MTIADGVVAEQLQASSNLTPRKVRGRNKSTIKLIEAMKKIADDTHPITGRGIAYKLFAAGLIESMAEANTNKVYYALKIAREEGTIPWEWIVDETRELELIQMWDSSKDCADNFYYRRDLWQTHEHKVELWSEKGTIRGLLEPVLDELGVGLRVFYGFTSATSAWDFCNPGIDDRPLIALYIGDYDPSGLCMSEVDLPERIKEYGGDHIKLRRIALRADQTAGLSSFSVETKGPKKNGKKGDPRYEWFKREYGTNCFELDAMDPNRLRDLVRAEISTLIDRDLWAEQEALEVRERTAIELHLRYAQFMAAVRP